jgi:hypothetical protein
LGYDVFITRPPTETFSSLTKTKWLILLHFVDVENNFLSWGGGVNLLNSDLTIIRFWASDGFSKALHDDARAEFLHPVITK